MSTSAPLSSSVDIRLEDMAATNRLARALARIARVGEVIGLSGDVGAGKTTFARCFIHARAAIHGEAETEVPSPTFTLVQTYPLADGAVWHFDLYRVIKPEEAVELGIDDAFAEGISLIEWPARLGSLLPDDWLEIRIEEDGAPQARRVTLTAHGAWVERLDEIRLDD